MRLNSSTTAISTYTAMPTKAEVALGLNDQRNEYAAQRVEDADHQRAHERTADRADAPDHDYHLRKNEDGVAGARLDRQQRPHHDAGECRQHGAEGEDQRVEQVDVDAERLSLPARIKAPTRVRAMSR